jgi:calmodulin
MAENYYKQLGITTEEFETLQEAYQLYDTEQKGYISIEQFSHIIASLGIISANRTPQQQQQQLVHIIQSADANHDNKIDFNEFVLTMFRYIPHEEQEEASPQPYFNQHHVFSDKDSDDEIMACFQFFDQDRDGRISQTELEQVITRFDTRLSPKEIKEMMRTADINRDGFIDFNEFKQLLPPL